MAHVPPKTVGNKSATARSSIFLSPSAVRIVVPFRKHLLPWLLLFCPWLLLFCPWLVCPVDGLVVVKIANAADAPITPTFTRLRRDLRIPVGGFPKSGMLASYECMPLTTRYRV